MFILYLKVVMLYLSLLLLPLIPFGVTPCFTIPPPTTLPAFFFADFAVEVGALAAFPCFPNIYFSLVMLVSDELLSLLDLDFLHLLNLQAVLALLVYLVELVVLDLHPFQVQVLLVAQAFLVVLLGLLVLVLV
jgi:hypothetical protein